MQIKKLMKKASIGLGAGLMVLSLSACGNSNAQVKNAHLNNRRDPSTATLAGADYKPGTEPYANVNHDKSTLNPRSWKYDHVIYSKLDHENRTSKGNTAYIDKKNYANDSGRTQQFVYPTGYHQKRYGQNQFVVNRGHEIAYSLSKGIDKQGKYNPKQTSGDQNNLRNLFTQSSFSNQKVQTIYESKVRNAIKRGYKVVYQVKPIFKGNDKMAKGVHMQAISTNHKLNFNVYLFNVQPGFKFNYANGTSKVDKNMKVVTPKGAPTFNDNKPYKSYGNRGRKYFGGRNRRSYRYKRFHPYYRNSYRRYHKMFRFGHYTRRGYHGYRRYSRRY